MGVGSPSQVVPRAAGAPDKRVARAVTRRKSREVPPPPARAAAEPAPRGEPRATALVGLIMGSRSDWETMQHAADALDVLGVPYEARVVSAHRTPDLLFAYAAEAEGRGIEVLIAGAGGAAHLPGMAAAKTILPVLGVPVQSKALNGMDSLLSIVQMPAGIPVGTLAIGRAGAVNAALLATAILGGKHARFRQSLRRYREVMTKSVLDNGDPREPIAEGTFAPPRREPQKGGRREASPPRAGREKK